MDELITKLAKDLRRTLEENDNYLGESGMPFFGMFPENCCQGTSVFLGMLLSHFLTRDMIKVVRGSTRDRLYHHFWVEVDSKIYDLTLDQFHETMNGKYKGIEKPVYGEDKHPLRNYFFYKEKMSAVLAFSIFVQNHANLKDVLPAYQFIRKKIEKMGWEISGS
ncbi:hypothetical protein ICC55_002889 [Salmonella enterica]|nr:hypothetical protein [Salmonella enterica]ECR7631887.1 hypothetical protein [Salmonella enterica]EDK5790637.1 hypothetical protein [Salmonella enterica]EEI0822443.1 hypothetical protein [Salmonella enterica]EGF5991451.1 hypothetical protein [Salmonella enterica]